MLKVGLTGGIGSGKTTVANLFKQMNIPIYFADIKAKELMHSNYYIKNNLINFFGEESFLDNGNLNTKYISNIVFKNKEKLNLLNNIVHPYLREDLEHWFSGNKNYSYSILEAAVLIESNLFESMDKIIVILSKENIRKDRVMLRDSVSEEDFYNRLKNQIEDADRLKYADFVIYNNETDSLIEQVYKINDKLING